MAITAAGHNETVIDITEGNNGAGSGQQWHLFDNNGNRQ
jgi:hypothetical protein